MAYEVINEKNINCLFNVNQITFCMHDLGCPKRNEFCRNPYCGENKECDKDLRCTRDGGCNPCSGVKSSRFNQY